MQISRVFFLEFLGNEVEDIMLKLRAFGVTFLEEDFKVLNLTECAPVWIENDY